MTEMTDTISTETHAYEQPASQVDYFGFSETHRYNLPDKTSWIEFVSMNEGAKAKFQKLTSRDLILERQSGNARMKMDAAEERHGLIRECVTGWNLVRNGVPVPFNKVNLGDFLTLSNPKVVEGLEKEIRKANPWLLAEMTSKDIQSEIDNLEEMKKVAEERERGEAS